MQAEEAQRRSGELHTVVKGLQEAVAANARAQALVRTMGRQRERAEVGKAAVEARAEEVTERVQELLAVRGVMEGEMEGRVGQWGELEGLLAAVRGGVREALAVVDGAQGVAEGLAEEAGRMEGEVQGLRKRGEEVGRITCACGWGG